MIEKLRKRMITLSAAALIVVFCCIYAVICAGSIRQLNTTADMLTERIAAGDGMFLPFDRTNPRPPDMERFPDFFTEETPFATRYFTVRFDAEGQIVGGNTDAVSAVSGEDAQEYARQALDTGRERGWLMHYRYRVTQSARGTTVVFVDGSMNRSTTRGMLVTAGLVLLGSLLVILVALILISRRAVRPMAESYEKQKQFVTDANHELKTPLTLILTNLDILETETGQNEWLDDIRAEGRRMSVLVSQLTALSRLDEDRPRMQFARFSLSEMVEDTVSEFAPLAPRHGLTLDSRIQPDLSCTGDEGALRRVVAILLDNAVKYADPGGSISLTLTARRHPVITVENTCSAVDAIELHRLFDRFYRADRARTASGSFGIGLSIAHGIVAGHGGEITAYRAGEGRIGFRVTLK